MNRVVFETKLCEITQILNYLEYTIKYAGNLISTVAEFNTDNDTGDFKPLSVLNEDALMELKTLSKKISSKADSLQNKIESLSLNKG